MKLCLENFVALSLLFYVGDAMSIAAREFAEDPCASAKRSNMVRAARNLLSAVTRLLILADMVDVHLLLKSLRVVRIISFIILRNILLNNSFNILKIIM